MTGNEKDIMTVDEFFSTLDTIQKSKEMADAFVEVLKKQLNDIENLQKRLNNKQKSKKQKSIIGLLKDIENWQKL